jgi:predicted component of type VI protein secretion system
VRRFEVREAGREPLPALDLGDDLVVIGSGASARVRLPAEAAREVHVRIERDAWIAIADLVADGKPRKAGDGGPIGDGVELELGGYRVRVMPAPADAPASPPQRTESLARELVRGLLGAGAAPAFEHERGPGSGGRRELPPPEVTLVIGRGDEAGWVILDEDLSREHAEIRRGWDGVTIRDLDSKNGTRIDGERVDGVVELHDGARIELGNCLLVFRDPAERHLRGEPPARTRMSLPGPKLQPPSPSPLPFVIAAAIAGLAAVGLVWILLA